MKIATYAKLARTLIASLFLLPSVAFGQAKDYAEIKREGAFILAHNRFTGMAIGVNTTDPVMLKLAIDLQQKIFALAGARPPLEHMLSIDPGSRDLRFSMIYFTHEQSSIPDAKPWYAISWEFHQPGYSINCSKRLRIEYADHDAAKEAINWFLKEELGTDLSDLEPKEDPMEILFVPVKTPEKDQGIVVRQIKQK